MHILFLFDILDLAIVGQEWGRVSGIKFYTARVFLHPTSSGAPSRREPFIESNLSPAEALKICCRNNAFGVELITVERTIFEK